MPRSRKSPQTRQRGHRTLGTSGSPKQSVLRSLTLRMIVGGQGDYKKNSPPPLPRENAPEAGVQIRRRRNSISKGCAAQQLLPSLGRKKLDYEMKSINWSAMLPSLAMIRADPQVMIETFVSYSTCSTSDCKIVSQTSPGFQIQLFGPKRPGFSKSPEVALTGYPPSPYFTPGMLNVPFLSTMRRPCQIENTVVHDRFIMNKKEMLESDLVRKFRKEEWHVLFTPPYCPDLQPIELFWAAGKTGLGI